MDQDPPSEPPPRRKRDPFGRHLLQWIFLFGTLASASCLVFLDQPVEKVAATFALIAVGIIAIAPKEDWLRDYLQRGGVDVGVLGLTFRLPPFKEPQAEANDPPAHDLMELRFKLEQKMAWVAKHLLGTPTNPQYLTLGSMEYDGLIESENARICSAVSALRVFKAGERKRGESLDDWLVRAQKIVASFRADVLAGAVCARLKEASLGQGGGERLLGEPAFAVERNVPCDVPRAMTVTRTDSQGGSLTVIPVFSHTTNSAIFKRVERRAKNLSGPVLFVLPPNPNLGISDEDPGTGNVTRLPDVVSAVERRLSSD